MSTQGSVTSSTSSERAQTLTVLLASLGVFLVALELTIVSVALPTIVERLAVQDSPRVSWIFTAYNLMVASLLLVFGWLADHVGRRRVFVVGLLLFALGSLLSGLSGELSWLIAGRALQGLGGSLMMPASLALIMAATSGGARDRAIATWGAMAGLAAALGPVLGGGLVELFGWRSVFLLNVPVAVIAIYFTRRFVAESKAERLSSVQRASNRLFLREVLAIPVALVRLPSFRWAGLATLPFVAGFTAWVVMAPSFLHEVWGYSPVVTGFAMLPAPLAMALVSRPSARLLVHLGYRGLIVMGALLSVAGLLWLYGFVTPSSSFALSFLPGALLFGAGIGMAFPMLAAAAVRDVSPARYAAGAAGVTTLRQAAMALGATLAIAIVGKQQGVAGGELLGQHLLLWLLCAGLMTSAAVFISGIPQSETTSPNPLIEELQGSDVKI